MTRTDGLLPPEQTALPVSKFGKEIFMVPELFIEGPTKPQSGGKLAIEYAIIGRAACGGP